jgi:hypothetical protein
MRASPDPRLSGPLPALAALIVVLSAPGPLVSPDGLAMRWQLSEGPLTLLRSGWPPLWPVLSALADLLLGPRVGAWALGVGCAAGAVLLAARLGRLLGGPAAGAGAALLLALLPTVADHAAVLDARPLGGLLFVATLTAVAAAGAGGRPLQAALPLAALAGLCRDEGAVLLPLVVGLGLIAPGLRRRPLGSFLLRAAAWAAPGLLWRGLRADRLAWEGLWADWATTWTADDFIALMGPADAPSPVRALALRAIDAGLEPRPGLLPLLRGAVPGAPALIENGLHVVFGAGGLPWLGLGLAACLAAGLVGPGPRGLRLLLLGLLVGLSAGLGLLPMAWSQSTAAANLQFLLPLAAALCFGGLGLLPRGARHAAAAALLLGLGLGARRNPAAEAAPSFVEESDAALLAQRWMVAHPPATGTVWCTWTGRPIVAAAGLRPALIPPRGLAWAPAPGDGLLFAAVDLSAHTGGRALELLRDPGWSLRRLADDSETAPTDRGRVPGAWFAYFERAPRGG